MDPRWTKGRDIQVGDVICTRVGNRIREIMTVTSVLLSEKQGHVFVHLSGQGHKSTLVLESDDSRWVLRTC